MNNSHNNNPKHLTEIAQEDGKRLSAKEKPQQVENPKNPKEKNSWKEIKIRGAQKACGTLDGGVFSYSLV